MTSVSTHISNTDSQVLPQEIVCDVLVVGAGPAGLFSAISILEKAPQAHVIVIDHARKPGRKLLISGGGQCNFTHAGSIKDFLSHYNATPSLIRKVLYGFNNEALRSWFAEQGVESIVREDGKVFPTSLKSGDVLTALLHALHSAGGVLMQNVEPANIKIQEATLRETSKADAEVTVTTRADSEQGDVVINARRLIVATGGCTYPKTGSDGSFFSLLQVLFDEHGIVVKPFEPALSPLYVKRYPFGDLEGLSIEAIAEPVVAPTGKEKSTPKGLLFRRDSFSGPAAMDASINIQRGDEIRINFAPERVSCDIATVAEELFAQSRLTHKETITLFQSFFRLPKRLAEVLLTISGQEDGGVCKRYAHDLSKRECKTLVQTVIDARFEVTNLGSNDESMVSRGGLCLDEIDFSTMRVKKMPAVFVAGECIDVTGNTGGFNLQWAFSSARRAGLALSEEFLNQQ